MSLKTIATVAILTALIGVGQETPAPRSKAAAAETAPPLVDSVIQMVQAGLSESLVVTFVQRQTKLPALSTANMIRLKKAGASDRIITALMGATVPASPQPDPRPHSQTETTSTSAATGTLCPAPRDVPAVAGIQKRRVAVAPFDYSAVKTQVTSVFNNDVNIGQGIRSFLTARMSQSGSVVVLEREKLKQLEAEQDLGTSSRIKQGTGAKVGRLIGADASLFGDIVIFGFDDKAKRAAAAGAGWPLGLGPIIAGMRNARNTEKAVVAINLRLVDVETGEILYSQEARGESARTSTNWAGLAGSWRGAAAANVDMTSSNFQETIIGEATQDAVNKIADLLNQWMPQVASRPRSIEGNVSTLDGCSMILTVGGNHGVHVGDHFEILRVISPIIDPRTHEVLDEQTEKVGDFVAQTVRDKVTIGQYGGAPLSKAYIENPGYAARLVPK